MALGCYPIPPPDPAHLAHIFGPAFMEDPANLVPVPSPRTPRTPHTPHSLVSKPMAIFELLEYIVNQPPPRLPSRVFSPDMRDFVDICLRKNPAERPDLVTLMGHPWLQGVEQDTTDVAEWVQDVIRLPNPQWSGCPFIMFHHCRSFTCPSYDSFAPLLRNHGLQLLNSAQKKCKSSFQSSLHL